VFGSDLFRLERNRLGCPPAGECKRGRLRSSPSLPTTISGAATGGRPAILQFSFCTVDAALFASGRVTYKNYPPAHGGFVRGHWQLRARFRADDWPLVERSYQPTAVRRPSDRLSVHRR
jgi:hypothetical protein